MGDVHALDDEVYEEGKLFPPEEEEEQQSEDCCDRNDEVPSRKLYGESVVFVGSIFETDRQTGQRAGEFRFAGDRSRVIATP